MQKYNPFQEENTHQDKNDNYLWVMGLGMIYYYYYYPYVLEFSKFYLMNVHSLLCVMGKEAKLNQM